MRRLHDFEMHAVISFNQIYLQDEDEDLTIHTFPGKYVGVVIRNNIKDILWIQYHSD